MARPALALVRAIGASALAAIALAALGLLAALARSAAGAATHDLCERLAEGLGLWLRAALVAIPVGLALGLGCERSTLPPPARRGLRHLIDQLVRTPPVVWGVLAGGLVTGVEGARVAAPLALALVAAPRVARSTADALDAVPDTLRHAALALGGGRWSVLARIVWPAARVPVLAGVLAAMARTVAEAAPLLALAAAAPSVGAPLPVRAAGVGPGPIPPGAALAALALAALVVALEGAAMALGRRAP
jgi:ABC-type phosphate transport system permease subunit